VALGRFTQRVLIGGVEFAVHDVTVNDSATGVGTAEFMVERDVVGDVLFDALDVFLSVVIEHTVDYPGMVAPLSDTARTLTFEGVVVEVCDERLGGGADGKRIRANTSAELATSVRVSGTWPQPEEDEDLTDLEQRIQDKLDSFGERADFINPRLTPDLCREKEVPVKATVGFVLADLAAAMGADLRIENGQATKVEEITATRDSVSDVLDELQRLTGNRWEIEGIGSDITLVWFNPLQRVGPSLKQPWDLVDGTLRVCKRSEGIINIARAAGWEYKDVTVKDYGSSPYTRVGRPDPSATSRTRNFNTIDLANFNQQRLHWSPFELEGDGWEVVGEPCVRVFTSGASGGVGAPFTNIPPQDVSDQYSVRVHTSEQMVEFRPDGIPPGGTGEAAFTVRRKLWIEDRDEASIAKYGPREGEPLDDDGGRTVETARETLNSYLSRRSGAFYDLEVETTRHGYEANTVIDVELDKPNLSRRMFVRSVRRTVDGTELTTQLQLADQETVTQGVGADVSGAIWPDTGEVDVGAEIVRRLKRVEKAALNPSSPRGAAAATIGVLRNPPIGDTDAYGWGESVTAFNTVDPVDDSADTSSTLPMPIPGSIL